MSEARRVGAARVGLAANFARAGRVARIVVPIIAAGSVIADRRRYRKPGVAIIASGLAVIEAAWVVRLSVTRQAWEHGGIAASETAFGVVGELLETLADPVFTPIDARPIDQYVQFVAASAAIANPTRIGAAASVGALAAASVVSASLSGRGRLPLGSPGSLALGVSFLTNTLAVRMFHEILMTNADSLDRARAERVEQGARLERQRERASQQRIAHDSALQILEAIAGGWDVDDAVVLERIDVEIAQLEALLEGRSHASDLAVAVRDVVARAAALDVALRVEGQALAMSQPSADALAAATGEALNNIRKHAGTSAAVVCLRYGTDGATVSIVDRGVGFDPASAVSGFGIRNSIEERLRAVGGTAVVWSRVGEGTTVEVWAPR